MRSKTPNFQPESVFIPSTPEEISQRIKELEERKKALAEELERIERAEKEDNILPRIGKWRATKKAQDCILLQQLTGWRGTPTPSGVQNTNKYVWVVEYIMSLRAVKILETYYTYEDWVKTKESWLDFEEVRDTFNSLKSIMESAFSNLEVPVQELFSSVSSGE